MQRNLVFAVAAIAVVGLVAFAVVRSNKPPAQEAAAPSPAAAPSVEPGAAPAVPANVPFIEQAAAKQLVDANNVTMLDVRDADAYLAQHVPGALQIPLSRVEGEVPYLPKGKVIVAYCTCPHDEAAIEAVQILQHAGVADAKVLRGGLQGWTALGFPTSAGMNK